jgi:hypothetical protein
MHDRTKAARAARNKRYYERRKKRVRCATVEISEATLDFLERSRWLRGDDPHGASAVAAAIKNMLELSTKL